MRIRVVRDGSPFIKRERLPEPERDRGVRGSASSSAVNNARGRLRPVLGLPNARVVLHDGRRERDRVVKRTKLRPALLPTGGVP